MRRQGVEAIRRQANARAEQLGEILSDFARESANATAKALNERGLPFPRSGSGLRDRSSTSALGSQASTHSPRNRNHVVGLFDPNQRGVQETISSNS